jgi:3-deoxy-D-manno-octulosonic-acid transferase
VGSPASSAARGRRGFAALARRPLGHAAAAASALAGLPLLAAACAHPRWRAGLSERLGLRPPLPPGSLWVHAASVGEVRAAARLVDRLRARGRAVCTSTVTATGRAAMRRARPGLPCHLAPLDHPWCVAGALARVAPAALVLVEAELWPAWIAAAARRGIPVALVSGRVSDKSFARYRRLARGVAPTLRRLAALGARTEADAERFLALGAPRERVRVTGDLKLDADDEPPAPAPELARVLGRAPLVVGGSTHAGEELALLDALDALERAGLAAALALAPRQPERVEEVARLLRRRGRAFRRRTQLGAQPLHAGEVLLLDTLGDLAGLYARAALCFVGGSLAPRGGHNVLEPASVGCPVLVGPHTQGIRHAVELLVSCGAARSVAGSAALAAAAAEWLRAPAAAARAGEAGRQVLARHRGSAERSAALVEALLGAP